MIDSSYKKFLSIQTQLVNVIRELESDLDDLKSNSLSKQKAIDSKNQQIEELIQFYNDTDQLMRLAKLQIMNIRITRVEIENITKRVLDRTESLAEIFRKKKDGK